MSTIFAPLLNFSFNFFPFSYSASLLFPHLSHTPFFPHPSIPLSALHPHTCTFFPHLSLSPLPPPQPHSFLPSPLNSVIRTPPTHLHFLPSPQPLSSSPTSATLLSSLRFLPPCLLPHTSLPYIYTLIMPSVFKILDLFENIPRQRPYFNNFLRGLLDANFPFSFKKPRLP